MELAILKFKNQKTNETKEIVCRDWWVNQNDVIGYKDMDRNIQYFNDLATDFSLETIEYLEWDEYYRDYNI